MVEGTNWKGDKSAYTYNGLGLRVNNTHTTHAGKVYARDYVIDYTSFENDDLMVFAEGNGQLEYEQKHVYAGSERIEQFTDKGNWERTLYVHEDVMGNTRYYTKANGQSFAELTYDAWGMPESPNKLLNNDHGNYVFATFTGHIYDTTLDIYFAEARFYDANSRTWLAMDPVKDGGNWYQYCYSNPTTYYDPTGLAGFSPFGGCVDMNKLAEKLHSGFRDMKGKISEFVDNVDWNRVGTGILKGAGAAVILVIGVAAVVATGGAALPAVAGLLAGTVSAGTAMVTVGTLAAGIASVSFGLTDVLEALQDLSYGLEGSSKASFNPLSDTLFTGKEDLYYGLEMASTLIASTGTATFLNFNMESEINASKMTGFGESSSYWNNNTTKPKQMHHYSTNKSKTYTQALKDITDKYGLDLDDDWNKELLPHQGRHPNEYHEFVLDEVRNIDNIANGNKEIFLELYESDVKSVIRANPNMLYSSYWKGLKE